MQTIHTHRRWRAPAAVLVAATMLVAGAAPASAAVFAPWAASSTVDAPRYGFHHHFYRGVPGQNRGTAGAGMSAVAADPGAQEEVAVSYCMERFKSYDPASGTYLGYDGYEHACP